jgi:hypothetical protein
MYSEFATDPKVQMLSEAMQRRLLMVMCMRCSNALVTLHETEIAFQLRISETELSETKAIFVVKGFVDSAWNVLNWDKRQFASDSSATRVAKHRLLQKEKQKQPCNVTETKSNALEQNRTDTEQIKKITVTPPDGVSIKVWADFLKLRKTLKAPVTETAMDGIQREADKAGYSLEQALRTCVERSWRGFKSDWITDKQPATTASGVLAGAI